MSVRHVRRIRETLAPALLASLLAAYAGAENAAAPSPPQASVHYLPRGYALGDVHPYYEQGVYYLFYLKPGAYDSALIRSTNLLDWTEVELRHGPPPPGDWHRPYYVLGVFRDRHAGGYRSYYGCRNRMVGSVSTDLLTWASAPLSECIPEQPDRYDRQRDPYVFWNEGDRRYWCVMTCRVKGAPEAKAGAVGYATSADLKTWQPHGDLFYPGDIGEPECPQLFRLGARWYLLASVYDRAVGKASYWVADAPTGPWTVSRPASLDGKDLCAAQVVSDGQRHLLFGWIPLTASRPGQQHWGGHLALPREVYQTADGALATRLEPAAGAAIRGDPLFRTNALAVAAADGQAVAMLPGCTGRLDIALELRAGRGCTRSGVLLGRCEVAVDFDGQRLVVRGAAGETVSELPVAASAETAARLRVVADGDIVEAFLDDRYSLAARLPLDVSAGAAAVYACSGSACFTNISVHRLKALISD